MDILNDEQKNELIETLKKDWPIEEEVSFNEFTISEKLQNHAYILLKYQEQLEKEKSHYDKLLDLKEKIEGERYHYYRFNNDENLQKAEIEKYYLPRDEKVLKVKKIIRIHEIRVNYFNICVKALDRMGWNMKNFLESLRRI